jgi:pimeloyl-ACP methyl ester carboxylesterase
MEWVPGVRVERVPCGEVSLEVAQAGAGKPIVFLHGFPEAWISWRHQMTAFAAAGRTAIAPNLRGYGNSDKPARTSDYRLGKLAADIAGLASALGHDSIDLVGHDWGGIIAYDVAARYPALVRKLAICNAPHIRVMMRALLTDSEQRRRSWYVFAFQLPGMPERAILKPDFLERVIRRTAAHPERFDDESLAAIQAVVQSPGTPRAAVSYYRAARVPSFSRAIVQAQTLVIWGEKDHALGTALLEGIDKYVRHTRIRRVADAGHFVQQDAPEEVTKALLQFFS